MYLADEVVQHLLGDVEVRDHAVAQRPDSHDVGGRSANHFLGFRADSQYFFSFLINRDYRWLVDDDAFAAHIYQGIGRSQVDADIQ